MTTKETLDRLAAYGQENIKRLLMNQGAKEPLFGVKVEDMKTLLKGNKHNTPLAKELFDTGNFDAMYLAGLMANGADMTEAELDAWANTAYGSSISEYTVPWVASENPVGYGLALKWIDSCEEYVAVCGWATLSSIVAVWPDSALDTDVLAALLGRVQRDVHQAPNRVRYTMNNFVITAGCYVAELTDYALHTAAAIGPVSVQVGNTACKVPLATEYIQRVRARGSVGKKRKTAKC